MTESTPSSPEAVRLLDYLRSRAGALSPAALRARARAAAVELEAAVEGLAEPLVRATPPGGEWTLAQVVDHIAQSTIRGAEELRHLVAGRRPPGPPVYEALLSGAAAWAPWDELLAGLREANGAFDAVLAEAEVGPVPVGPTARVILVVNRAAAGERPEPETFAAELGWKEYALVQRLHLLDHRSQVRQLRAALGASTP